VADIVKFTEYVKESITTPLLSQDPVYTQLITSDSEGNSGIKRIINQIVAERGFTVESLPSDEEGYVLLLVKKEIYLRLATSTAAEWNVETEFTKLLKSTRFDHYIKLLQFIQKDVDQLINSGQFSFVEYADVIIDGKNGTARNYNTSLAQDVKLTISNITADSVDLDWNIFNTAIARFLAYRIRYSTEELYDEYENPPYLTSNFQSVKITDIKRTKYRIKNLESNTTYYITLTLQATNGSEDTYSTTFTTL
jgi:hypothetical protein